MKGILKFSILALFLLLVSCGKEEKGNSGGKTGDGLKPASGMTVYGKVLCGGKGLAGVVVSDGVVTTQTNFDGVYQLPSKKHNGLVFIPMPSGYKVPVRYGATPGFWQPLHKDAKTAERVDFTLTRDRDQTSHTVLCMGDIHIYNASSSSLFQQYLVPELNKFATRSDLGPVVGLTLGDMSWDWHWYHSGYRIPEYLSAMDQVKGLPVFFTVGNHDHDMNFDSRQEYLDTGEDWTCQKLYRELQGPTYYSFNIGQVHYVSLDDVITVDQGDITDADSRGCWRGITHVQMQWLLQDLSYVDHSTPIIVTFHIPLFGQSGSEYFTNKNNIPTVNWSIEDIAAPFMEFDKVIFITAHTHNVYNKTFEVEGKEFVEWCNGAVCGHFWSPANHGMNLCNDGAPGGYRIITADGKNISSVYKHFGKPENFFFRSYDRNQMNLEPYTQNETSYDWGEIGGPSSANYIYLDVWDYKPGWSITAKEGTKNLTVTRCGATYDPLYALLCTKKLARTPRQTYTIFKVKASSATSTVTITVKDEFGHVRTEEMKRPKAFTFETYRDEQ